MHVANIPPCRVVLCRVTLTLIQHKSSKSSSPDVFTVNFFVLEFFNLAH